MLYFEGRVKEDSYVIFTEESAEFAPSKDFARPGFLLEYELEFMASDGKGDATHLPIEEELWPRW